MFHSFRKKWINETLKKTRKNLRVFMMYELRHYKGLFRFVLSDNVALAVCYIRCYCLKPFNLPLNCVWDTVLPKRLPL